MNEQSMAPSARLFEGFKTEEEISNDQTHFKTIYSRITNYESTVQQFKQYRPRSNCIDIDKLRQSKLLKIKKSKNFAYFGEIVGRQRHGLGVMIYENGKIYEGEWQQDLKSGQGYEEYPSGNRYTGDFHEGKPHGTGSYSWANGQTYEGQWHHGQRQGTGTWKGTKDDSYVGEWRQSKPDGFGVLVWANGDRYEGYFTAGLKNGEGYEKYSSGDLYKGTFQMGKKNGYGEYFWANSGYYKGTFVDGLRDGSGVWHGPNGDIYQGQYSRGKKQGYGIYTWQNGTVYKGNFHDDLRHGFGQMLWSDGSFYKGGWKAGIQNGIGEMYSPTNGLRRCNLVNNVIVQVLNDQHERPRNVISQGKGNPNRQNKFNRTSRESLRSHKANNLKGNSKVLMSVTGKMKSRTTKQKANKTVFRSLTKKSESFENSHFRLNQSRPIKKTTQIKEGSPNQRYRSPTRQEYIPHSSFYPHQMHHRKVKTAADSYQFDSPTDIKDLPIVNEKPYNLTKLMLKFKLVRGIVKH